MFFEAFPIFTHEDLRFSQYFRRLRHYIRHVSTSAALNEGIVWRAGSPSQGNQLQTWAEVYTLIQASDGDIVVFVDNSIAPCIVPVGTYDLMGHVTFSPHISTADNIPTINVELADGAVFKNIKGLDGNVGVIGNSTSGPALVFDIYNPQGFGNINGGVFINNGTVPMIEVDGVFLAMGAYSNAGIVEGTSSAPFVNVINSGAFVFSTHTRGRIDPPGAYLNWISGDASSVLIYQYDNSFIPNATHPLFAGTVIQQLTSEAISLKYDDSLINPQLGADRVQTAIDQLKPRSGNTASRPSTPYVGQYYLDTDLAPVRPIWWDGSNWIDATGTVV